MAWPLRIGETALNHDKKIQQKVESVLESVGLIDAKMKVPNELSGGMKARVALARAIVTKPSVLFVDEALSPLDVGWRYQLLSSMRRMCDDRKMLIVNVTHDLECIAELCDQVIVLSNNGRVAAIFDTGKDENHQNLNKMIRQCILEDHPANTG